MYILASALQSAKFWNWDGHWKTPETVSFLYRTTSPHLHVLFNFGYFHSLLWLEICSGCLGLEWLDKTVCVCACVCYRVVCWRSKYPITKPDTEQTFRFIWHHHSSTKLFYCSCGERVYWLPLTQPVYPHSLQSYHWASPDIHFSTMRPALYALASITARSPRC